MKRYALYFGWLIACIGVLFSLYFSDVRKLEPCRLCWYQRMALFPLAIILGIAAYRGFCEIARYVLPQVFIGLGIALYQIGLQEIPGWNPIDLCGAGPSCSTRMEIFGPLTVPMFSALGFALIAACLLYSLNNENRDSYK